MSENVENPWITQQSNAAKWRMFVSRLRGMMALRDNVLDHVEFVGPYVSMADDGVEVGADLYTGNLLPDAMRWGFSEDNPRIYTGFDTAVFNQLNAEEFYDPNTDETTEEQAKQWETLAHKVSEIEEIIDTAKDILSDQGRYLESDQIKVEDDMFSTNVYEMVPDTETLIGYRTVPYMEILWPVGAATPRVRYFD